MIFRSDKGIKFIDILSKLIYHGQLFILKEFAQKTFCTIVVNVLFELSFFSFQTDLILADF